MTATIVSFFHRFRAFAHTLRPFESGSNDIPLADLGARHEPSRILSRCRVKHVVWFEDTLVFYGSNTCVFDFFLLVPSPRQAAAILRRFGYEDAPVEPLFPNDARSCRGGVRLAAQNDESGDGVVLISASVWNYNLKETVTIKMGAVQLPIPPFRCFLESIMEKWLSLDEGAYQSHIAWSMSLTCLIGYCYSACAPDGSTINHEAYAEHLRPEFRELHYDMVSKYPGQSPISSYRKREYHAIRWEQIKRGAFVPRPYPAANFPVSMAEYPHLTGLDSHLPRPRKRKGGKKDKDSALLRSIDETETPL